MICAALAALPGCGQEAVLTPDEQVKATIAAVRGVPQDGSILGAGSSAPTLHVFARVDDLRLAGFVADALPRLVRERVRPGRLRIRLQAIGVDEDGRHLAGLVHAAGLQDRFWDLLGSVVAQYPGIVDDEFTGVVLGDVPGLRRGDVTRERASRRVQAAIARADDLAQRLDLPRFAYVIEEPDGSLEVLRAQTTSGLLRDLADPSKRVSHHVPAVQPFVRATPSRNKAQRARERHPFPYPLREGASGPAVEELQKGLRDLKVTGVYDDATREAVSAFQRDHGLNADGVTGEQTWAAIFSPRVAR